MSTVTSATEAPWPGYALPHGIVFNGYRIERVLGSGGFGVINLARDLLLRPFAVKAYFPRQPAQALVLLGRVADAGDGIDRVRHRSADRRPIRHVAAADRRSQREQESLPAGHGQQQPVRHGRAQRSVGGAARRVREGAAGGGRACPAGAGHCNRRGGEETTPSARAPTTCRMRWIAGSSSR